MDKSVWNVNLHGAIPRYKKMQLNNILFLWSDVTGFTYVTFIIAIMHGFLGIRITTYDSYF